ncbi:MAG: hypothetical protein KDA20_01045 [Phycisphaerales bacterium]|nr:hypothetical protein [Phycisphaerales bacterium]
MTRPAPRAIQALALLWTILFASVAGIPTAQSQTLQGTSPVTAEIRFFGVGGHVRPGDLAGIQVELTDAGSGKASRRVLVQLHQRDVDGDELLAQRETTLTVGVARSLWLYMWMPWSTSSTTDLTLSVRELSQTESAGLPGVGEPLLAKRVRPAQVNSMLAPMIGVVGREDAALSQYRLEDRNRQGSPPTVWHEAYDIVGGLEPRWLPDQWMGLAPFETIVWTDGDPDDLTEGRDEALIEWVQRGGHLVIVPPVVGSNWFAPRSPLASIMPTVGVTRLENRSLEPYRNILTVPEVAAERAMPDNTVIYSFAPQDNALPNDAIPLFTGPDGCIVVRRVIGTGMVTVIGLDVRNRRLTTSGLLAAEALWHPILGKRFDILTPEQQQKYQGRLFAVSSVGAQVVDAFIGDKIAKTGAAGVGVLLALVVFVAYWLLAGPGGYALLKARGIVRHAWVAFVATVAVFAAIAWTGAKAISPTHFEATHMTFLDQVYAEGVQKTRTYASCLLPIYGEATLTVGEPGLDQDYTQCLMPWAEQGSGSLLSFPDARAYAWNIAQPQRITVPARSTIKQLRLEWMGGPRSMDAKGGSARWGNIRPLTDVDAPRQNLAMTGEGLGPNRPITGKLVHEMAAPLRNVKIIYCAGIKREELLAIAKDRLRCEAYVWEFDREWNAGDANALDLANLATPDASLERFFSKASPTITGLPGDSRVKNDEEMFVSFFNAAEPFDYHRDGSRIARLIRRECQRLDLSQWLTMPCLIVMGEMEDATPRPMGSPTPLLYGSGDNPRQLPTSGTTWVRWIYPMPARPVYLAGTKVEPLPEDRPADPTTPPTKPAPNFR